MATTTVVRNFVSGKRKDSIGRTVFHVHRCDGGGDSAKAHEWQCDSPYCEDPGADNCPEHGGFEPIVQGREPWRGR